MIKEIYNYREFLKTSVKKNIRGKYKASFLGVLWSFINPLLMTLVYAIVFSIILRDNIEHYATFVVIGVLPWNWFTTTISQGTFIIVGNSDIIKKVYFPREILPISCSISGLINYLISVLIIIGFLIFSGIGLSWYILLLPLIAIIQFILTLAIIFITSSIDVYIRDFEYIINFVIMMMFYGTPILYRPETLPDTFRTIIKYNPMSTIINSYRDIFFYQRCPDFTALLVVTIFSIILLIIGVKVFGNLKKRFAEEV